MPGWRELQQRATDALKDVAEYREDSSMTGEDVRKAMLRAQRYIVRAHDADGRKNPCRKAKPWEHEGG